MRLFFPKNFLSIKRLILFSLIQVWFFSSNVLAFNQPQIHHEIKVVLDIDCQILVVEDSIQLPESLLNKKETIVYFSLNESLKPLSLTHGVSITQEHGVSLQHYSVQLPQGLGKFVIKYQSQMNHLTMGKGGKDVPGGYITPRLTSSEGIFLDGSSYWLPSFGDMLMTFSMEVKIHEKWDVVTQGKRTQHKKDKNWKHIKWKSSTPQEEIFLIAGKFFEYGYKIGNISIMAFLRTPDQELADQYLEVTGQYLKMYNALIGQYPYAKFALVENIWESGLGMPSFTLIGSKVLRFPFILHSSFPHEILHNWWGNGIYVNNDGGNWSEGLTTYLADHLIKEEEGKGVAFRRTALQRYSDYTRGGMDFPLKEFRERKNIATQAVGYGKTMMFFHMLRQELGDDIFTQGLQKIYHGMKFKRASFFDWENIFSDISGKKLTPFFEQWVQRTGAPVLEVSNPRVDVKDTQYVLKVSIKQTQPGPAYLLKIPISVTLENHADAYQDEIIMEKKKVEIHINFQDRPLRLDVDPEFDLFRRLDPMETPAALSASFGSKNTLFILPSAGPKEVLQEYQEMARVWAVSGPDKVEIKTDEEIQLLPSDRNLWILGWENRFLKEMEKGLKFYGVSYQERGIQIDDENFLRKNHSFIFTIRNPKNPKMTISWIGTDIPEAFPGLKRKLSHYGKYSYLVFEGEEPRNILKKQWPVFDSPMTVHIPLDAGQKRREIRGRLKERKSLASLPRVPSSRVLSH